VFIPKRIQQGVGAALGGDVLPPELVELEGRN